MSVAFNIHLLYLNSMHQFTCFIAISLTLLILGSGSIIAQPLNIVGSAQATSNQTISRFGELPFEDVLPNFDSQIQFSLPDNFEFANTLYDSAFFAIDPFGFGFPDNFFATQFGLLNVSLSENFVKELKLYESDTLTSIFMRGLDYKYFSCQNTAFNSDSALVRIDFFSDKIVVYMSGIPTKSCPEFRIHEGLPGRNGRYQSISWFIIRNESGNSYRSGFSTDSLFNGEISQLHFQPGNINGGIFPFLRGGFPEIPIRLDIVTDPTSSTGENPNSADLSGDFNLRNGRVIFLDNAGRKLKLTALNSIGQVIIHDVFEVDLTTINSTPVVISCVTVDGIKSKMYYIVR